LRNLRDYLRIKDAAEFLGVTEQTLRNWEAQGKIAVHRHPINRYRLFREQDLKLILKKIERSATRRRGGR
jgi:MerR family transcriptional regulator, copper efflux regulator